MLQLGGPERVVAVLVSSLDGVVAMDGQSRALSSDRDRALIGAWREAADALLVGVPTLTAELYGGGLFPAEARARRVLAGTTPTPPIVTVDRSGSLDVDVALRAREPLDLIAYVPADPPDPTDPTDPTDPAPTDRRVRWVPSDELSLAAVLRDVRTRFGYRLIVAEPGPKLLRALREEHQLSDISLTVAPIFADQGARMEAATGAQPLRAVDVETIDAITFVHMLAGDRPPAGFERPAAGVGAG